MDLSSDVSFLERVTALLKNALPDTDRSSLQVVKLAGEASYREYYRLTLGPLSLILMKLPKGASSISEEVTKLAKQIEELPFINVQKYFSSLNLPVPKIIGTELSEGFILLEDLGDESLERAVLKEPEKRISIYQRAVALLAVMETKARVNVRDDCLAFHRQFDADLFVWELNHFLEYGIEDRLGVKIPSIDRAFFDQAWKTISSRLISMPQGFVHRDYQSRNLIVKNGEINIIDFQDALKGPQLYDLVALLRDSYIELSWDEIKSLREFYHQSLAPDDPYKGKLEMISADFNWITLQRKLKDSGRFQFIKTVKGNPSFMKHLPLSLKYVSEALDRIPELTELKSLLAKHCPELA